MTKTLTQVSAMTLVAATVLGFSLFGLAPKAEAAALTPLSSLQPGDLIRGENFNAVYYYGADGFRYVFPNDKAYFTWYSNFASVKWVSDANLTKIQIGGNVTYKPGVRMIKINSDPRVYVVGAGGVIHAIASEAVATALYGSTWNKQIDDVPDGFFSNYRIGGSIDAASMFSVTGETASAANINVDKGLKAATVVTVTESGFSPANVTITAGTAVRFVNNGTMTHGASSDDGSWGTGTLQAGENFSKYFKNSGTILFHDKYNESVKGSIIVQ